MWKNDFIKLLYPIEILSKEEHLKNIRKAYSLKSENIPEKLFKYNWIGEEPNHSIDNFINNQVYLNQPKNFNDIFDCRFWIDFNKIAASIGKKLYNSSLEEFSYYLITQNITLRQYLRSKLRTSKEYKNHKKLRSRIIIQHIYEMFNNYEILTQKTSVISCFSELVDSSLMWGHYANKHSGFVLEYNFKTNPLEKIMYPIIYQKKFFDSSNYFINMITNGNKNLNNLYLKLPALIKSLDWNYEKEWRLIIGEDIFKKGTLYTIPIPKAIYLGVNIKNDYRKLLINIAKSKNMKIYQMVMKKNEYGLYYKEIK